MSNTHLPYDGNNNPIPVLSLVPGGAQQVTIAVANNRNAVAFPVGTKAITLTASVDCRVRFGDSAVTAASTDSLLLAGIPYDLSIQPDDSTFYPYVAVIRDGTVDGKLDISLRA